MARRRKRRVEGRGKRRVVGEGMKEARGGKRNGKGEE